MKRGGLLFFLALALVGTAALVSANNLLFLIVAAMLATLLISGLVSRLMLAGLELELVLPEHIAAKRPTTAGLRLRNNKRLIPSFSIHLRAAGSNPITEQALYFAVLPGRTTTEGAVTAFFPRRGAHKDNLFLLVTRFPFGFLEKVARLPLRKETVVYPCLDPQPGFEKLLQGILGEIAQNRRGAGADLYRIRPYIATENARHVDWKTSAHTGSLQVREFASEELGPVEIMLDRAGHPPEAWFENAVACCAYLVWELTDQHRPVTLRSQGFEARDDRYAMLRFLALTEPVAGARPLPTQDDAAFQILFSALPDAADLAGECLVVGLDDLRPDHPAHAPGT